MTRQSPDPFDLRVESRFKNAILHRLLLEEFGSAYRRSDTPSLKKASAAMGPSVGTLCALLSIRESPFTTKGCEQRTGRYYTRSAEKVANYLGVSLSELFPVSLYALRLPAVVVREFQSVQVLSLDEVRGAGLQHLLASMKGSPERGVVDRERVAGVAHVLAALTPKEEKVVRLRFGIGCGREHSLDEIAEEMGVSRERIRQIEAKALRQLRRLDESGELFGLVDFQTAEGAAMAGVESPSVRMNRLRRQVANLKRAGEIVQGVA